MPTCRFCGEAMPARHRICTLCGSELPDLMPTAEVVATPKSPRPAPVVVPKELPPGGRFCPACGIIYDRDYTDAFCICGTELQGAAAPAPSAPPPVAPGPVIRAPAVKPPSGTRCLVLVGPEREPIQYFALAKDVTLIGRLDAPSGSFPDIDVDEWLDAATARKVSRQHALVLRSRVSGNFSLRPLPGNTGTQVETEMVLPLQDCPLTPGVRMILGGAARFKFEIT
jgi:FHA domain